MSAGHRLVQAGHVAACDVAARVQPLESAMGCLRAEAVQRRRRLQQAQEAQQFLLEVRGLWSSGGWGGHEDTRLYSGPEGDPHAGLPALCIFCHLHRMASCPQGLLHVSQKTDL